MSTPKELIQEGKLIEAGWTELCNFALLKADSEQLELLRDYFFAGVQYMFSRIDDDTRMLTKIKKELDNFIEEFNLRIFTAGSA